MGISASQARLLFLHQRQSKIQTEKQEYNKNQRTDDVKDEHKSIDPKNDTDDKPQTLNTEKEAIQADIMETMNLISQNVKASFNTFNK